MKWWQARYRGSDKTAQARKMMQLSHCSPAGDDGIARAVHRGSGALYAVVDRPPTPKDMLRTCPVAARAAPGIRGANAAAVADSGPRDPARAVTPTGTMTSKNAAPPARSGGQRLHSNRVDRTSGSENFRRTTLGAGPRATGKCQLAADGSPRPAAPDRVGGSGTAAHAVALSREA